WLTPKENAERRIFPNHGSIGSRKIVQKMLDGNVVQIWDSILLASGALKISESCISECCSGKQKTSGGWRWMYYEDHIEPDPNKEWREIELDSRKFRVSSLGRI
ncbi:5198_t:CDS:1, partial [Ambispora leptoticha]